MFGFNKKVTKVTKSSPLSDFVRNTSSGERKKIYKEAINNAIKSQQKVIEKSKQVA